MSKALDGRVALVAGGTRGGGRAIAVELGRAGATVYVTGRTTRGHRSEMGRPETIEETAELVAEAGGTAIAVRVDHLVPDEVRALIERIDAEQGRLDVLVNDVWGGDVYLEFGRRLWEHPLDEGLRMLRLGIDTHAITSHFALPLVIRDPGGLVVEMTDGTAEFNAAYRADAGFFYDLVKVSVQRMALAQAEELKPFGGTAVAVTPGWLRSEAMLDLFGVTEDNWRDATAAQPHFCISESPAYVGRAVAALAADPRVARWSGQTLSSGHLAGVYDFTDTDGTRPDFWRYAPEVQYAGRPADDTGYR
ncbi:NAD(P)-dependent dehydrogenase (short-subunit alcohol dehydrogenase family) [Spinactinospora alkalitolerans]|uniref:NAD(P)-dependent dehydrogenase (Short-subunit alcohol dehydrogenase family) n=1 Tax=Spinactinospora alkalitolerans TaxID=687207 RepID=A0A852U2N9_9ACTN|nr:SDR family oxidoreductase [Spinactinospora alkalitolerans]NYE48414.1 NAD(P)-dependent dehydrogenase (short-subunit alcohol dehydrogenase family) [Spinactinospora alkalitolerans]